MLKDIFIIIILVFLFESGKSDESKRKEEHILGSSVDLWCSSSFEKPVRVIDWHFNGKHIVTDNNKYTIRRKNLTVNRLDLRDKGTYKCIVRFYNSSKTIKNEIFIDVLYPPVVLKKPSTPPVLEGNDLQLSCMADGNPSIKYEWFKEKMITDRIRAKVKLGGNNQNLTIQRIKKTDEGRYFCKVSNALGTKETFVDVVILIPPSVSLSSTRIIQAENSSLDLVCESSGVPMPKLDWVIESKEGKALKDHMIRLQPGIAIISIPQLRREHAGNITCQASNSAGFNSSSVTVIVQYSPEVQTERQEVKAWPGLELVLTCNVSSYPLAHVTWYKNSRIIKADSTNASVLNIKISDRKLFTTLMTSLDSDLNEQNVYSCEARNAVGRNKRDIFVLREALPEQPEIEFIDEGHESVRIIMKSQTNNEDGYSVDGSTDNDHSYYEEDEVDSNVFQKEYIENNIFENIHVKEIKLKKNKDKLNQKQSSTQNISTKISHKDLFERINANNSTHKLPLLYWKVSVDSTEDTHHQSLILPYTNEILVDNLSPSVMYNVSIVVSNFVGYSPPLYTQVFTSETPTYSIDKNISFHRGKNLRNKAFKKPPLSPSSSESDISSGVGFIMLVGIGSLIVLVVIFVLIGLVLYWQKRSLEKAKLLGKCPHHNVVTTLTRHDLEPQICEQKTLTRRADRMVEIKREATATTHLSPIGYYKGDTVDDEIDHLNSSYCNK